MCLAIPARVVELRAGDQATIDLGGGYLVPGFIDTQVNGGGVDRKSVV